MFFGPSERAQKTIMFKLGLTKLLQEIQEIPNHAWEILLFETSKS